MKITKNGEEIICIGQNNTIQIWKIPNKLILNTLEGHLEEVTCLKLNHLLPILISGTKDKTVKFWDISDNEIIYDLENNQTVVNSLQIYNEMRINLLEIHKKKLLLVKKDIDSSLDSVIENSVSFTDKISSSINLMTENVDHHITDYINKIKEGIKSPDEIAKHLKFKFLESVIPKKQENYDKNN